jgi:hypothetical protein
MVCCHSGPKAAKCDVVGLETSGQQELLHANMGQTSRRALWGCDITRPLDVTIAAHVTEHVHDRKTISPANTQLVEKRGGAWTATTDVGVCGSAGLVAFGKVWAATPSVALRKRIALDARGPRIC